MATAQRALARSSPANLAASYRRLIRPGLLATVLFSMAVGTLVVGTPLGWPRLVHALLGTAILIGTLLISARVLAMARGSGRGRRIGRALAIALAALAALFVLRVVGGALVAGGLGGGLLDGGLAAVAAVGAALLPLPRGAERRVRLAGPVAWLLAVGAALLVLHLVDGLPAILNSAAPVLYSVLALFGH